mmetsp:Transcript_54263/g.116533  ORF Transcript_54263/g.116533 Transcript_54263/m.116533 type:complete len:362 (+) Transcript_54263:38-1123(+)
MSGLGGTNRWVVRPSQPPNLMHSHPAWQGMGVFTRSEEHRLLRHEAHPPLLALLSDPNHAPAVASARAPSYDAIAKRDLETIPTRGRAEVAKDDGGSRGALVLVALKRLQSPVPPSEGAASLHLPLELHRLTRCKIVLYARNDLVGVRALGFRLRGHPATWLVVTHSEVAAGRSRTEAEPVLLRGRDVFRHHLAGAQICGDVAFELGLPLDPCGHGRHGKAQLLFPVEDLDGADASALNRIPVARLPILLLPWSLIGVVQALIECRPLCSVDIRPTRPPEVGALVGEELGTEAAEVRKLARRPQETGDLGDEGDMEGRHAAEIGAASRTPLEAHHAMDSDEGEERGARRQAGCQHLVEPEL